MAMQAGMGFSKLLIIAGAGYTSTILMRNGKLSDLIGELQAYVKKVEKSGLEGDAGCTDALTAEVRRLAAELRIRTSNNPIIVNPNSFQNGDLSSLIIPAATLGALGYGYMWLKGISFSDLMYVTKRNMENAVSNVTKHLESVTEAVSAAKRHLTQRIESLDFKMDRQNQVSKDIQANVSQACEDLGKIDAELSELQKTLAGLDGKLDNLEYNQNFANVGVYYLCRFVDGGNKIPLPKILQEDQFHLSGTPTHFLTGSATPQGLKEIADALSDEKKVKLNYKPISMKRTTSAIC